MRFRDWSRSLPVEASPLLTPAAGLYLSAWPRVFLFVQAVDLRCTTTPCWPRPALLAGGS